MTPQLRAAAKRLRTFLDDVEARYRKAGLDPTSDRSARVFPGFPYDLTNGDLHALLGAVELLDAAVERTIAKMRAYDTGAVNVRQVINLLSPTWPDGNFEQPTDHEDSQ